jgi:pimeloyl-ACP methyl ester carboxylesterase
MSTTSPEPPPDEFTRWQRAGRTYRHRGRSIFYRTEGDGPPLLLLHGFPSASWDFQPLWAALTARFQVVAADMLGFGWSDKPRRAEYSILDQASCQEGLLRELGIGSAHVLAHDYGDTVAQELLARQEDRAQRGEAGLQLQSVCFLNGGLFPETHRPRKVQKLLASPLGPLIERLITRAAFDAGMIAIFGRQTPPSARFLDELWTLLRHQDGHLVLHHLIGYMAERRRHRARWVGALLGRHVKTPLRVIDGAADPVSGAHMVARYRELVPQPDTVELPDIGHYPQVEAPQAVLAEFLAFHQKIGTQTRLALP